MTGSFSLNQMTTPNWPLPDLVDGCERAGVRAVGLWREPVARLGLARTARMVGEAGLRVSSLCRGGFLTGDLGVALEDNRRAVDEAAELGAGCLVMVVGGLPPGSRDLDAARARVHEALAVLAPYAGERGVRLALEPMHPVYCADRGVLSTLGQALDLAEQFPAAWVGVVVDTFHVWWDPQVWAQIARAGGRIASFQVSDWATPLPADVLLGRAMMGDGHIDLPRFHAAVRAAGYRGDVEVEIFNAEVWSADPAAVLATALHRYAEFGD